MTLTETREIDTSVDAAAPPVERGIDALVATGEHKSLGLRFAALGLAALLGGVVAALLFLVMGDAPVPFLQPGSRLATAASVGAFVIGIPALWLGLATYVVPLQIGGHRLALPRLHNLAWWLLAGGSVLAALSIVVDETRLNSIVSSVPPVPQAAGEAAEDATLLLIASLVVVSIATLLGAANLFVTILNRRGDGVRLIDIPAFSWGALSTSFVLILSTPVFLAGLVLLYLDQRYGGSLFTGGTPRVWEHELWLLGRPESLVFFAATLGIYCDIAATVLRRPLAFFPVARAGAAATPLFALLAWAGATGVLRSPFGPFGNGVSVLIAVPAALCVLTWLASIRGARPAVISGALPMLAHFAIDGLLVAAAIGALIAGVEGTDADSFRSGQVTLFVLAQTVLGLAAGLLYWAPKLRGRTPSIAQGGGTALLLLGGATLFAAPSYIAGLGGDDGLSTLGAVGAAVFALGILSLVPTVVGPPGNAPSDPYEGLTLEWSAASPPVRHNFDEVPEVRSPYPLYDARSTTSEATT